MMKLWWVVVVAKAWAAQKTTLQFFYDTTTVASESIASGGCVVASWNGTDPLGVAGPPWLSTVRCGPSAGLNASGAAVEALSFYLVYGSAALDNETLEWMGDAYWVGEGAATSASIFPNSLVYVVGGVFELSGKYVSPTSLAFRAPRKRFYSSKRAIDGTDPTASNAHDPHVGNGTSNARDLTFSKGRTRVDPPSITVLNCNFDHYPDLAFVWYHLHPAGALYLPYAGTICFSAGDERCATPGFPRWVAPNLFYYESFAPRDNETAFAVHAARRLVDAAFPPSNASECDRPVVFAVTNFDPDDEAGQPNFDDMPNGQAKWGYFETMTVRTTTVLSKTTLAIDG